MSDGYIHKYFLNNSQQYMQKWIHYLNIYEKHLERFRGKSPVMIEIGVFQGGSLKMWKDYLGETSKIVGIDIDPKCKKFEEEGIEIYIGNQSDPKLINQIFSNYPKIDIILDDGSHKMKDMRESFNLIYNHLSKEGVYLIEDTHTCYDKNYGGGYKDPNSFIEFAKNKVDELHAHHTNGLFKVSPFTCSTQSITYYDGIIVFEKKAQGTRNDLITEGMQETDMPYSIKSNFAVKRKDKKKFIEQKEMDEK